MLVQRNHAHGAVFVRIRRLRSRLTGSAGAGGAPAGRGGIGSPSFFSSCTSDCHRGSVKKKLGSTCSRPTCAANASAPAPDSITHCDFSITARARLMGCRVRVTPATAPAFRVAPSMMAESRFVFAVGSEHGAAPRIEERVVFKNANGRLDCIERRAAPVEHFGSRFDRLRESGAISRFGLGIHGGALNHTRAAVQHDRPVMNGRLLSLLRRLRLPRPARSLLPALL